MGLDLSFKIMKEDDKIIDFYEVWSTRASWEFLGLLKNIYGSGINDKYLKLDYHKIAYLDKNKTDECDFPKKLQKVLLDAVGKDKCVVIYVSY